MRSLCLVLVLVSLGCKGEFAKCEQACRNYAHLVFWEEADKEIEAAPREQRDELRKKKLGEFTNNLERGLHLCTSKCQDANHKEDIACMIDAKTATKVKECLTK
jgi:hypothetical protein